MFEELQPTYYVTSANDNAFRAITPITNLEYFHPVQAGANVGNRSSGQILYRLNKLPIFAFGFALVGDRVYSHLTLLQMCYSRQVRGVTGSNLQTKSNKFCPDKINCLSHHWSLGF